MKSNILQFLVKTRDALIPYSYYRRIFKPYVDGVIGYTSPTDSAFSEIVRVHNGNNYLVPSDLENTPSHPRRVLIVGSCLSESWSDHFGYPCDFFLTNNLNQLPDAPPHPIEDYDFQIIQIPLRSIVPDNAFWHISFSDNKTHEEVFNESVQRLRIFLQFTTRWTREHGKLTFVVNFLTPQQNPMGRFAPRYDLRNPTYFIEQLNVHLAQEVSDLENTYLLDIDSIASSLGKKYIQDDIVAMGTHGSTLGNNQYEQELNRIEPIAPMTKYYVLRTEEFITAIGRNAEAMYKTVRGTDAVKLIIVDLDDILWRGVAADAENADSTMIEGWHLGFIEALLLCKKRGVILAIVSKNDEERINGLWEGIMNGRLSLDDFAVRRINWKSKAENISDIIGVVNVLPSSVIFIDDNPVERDVVKQSFPGIRVLGKYPYFLRRILLWSLETQTASFTNESSNRTEMIKAQVERETLRRTLLSREDFLVSLAIKVNIFDIMSTKDQHFKRAFELINKTNQFNTTGRRWTHEEFAAFLSNGGVIHAFEVEDKFTKYGIVGCVLICGNMIEQFVMSCRVIGLDVEKIVLNRLSKGEKGLQACLYDTKINAPCHDIYERCGFIKNGENKWIYREG